MSQYCAHQTSRPCHFPVAKSGDYFVRIANETNTKTLKRWQFEPFFFILQKIYKRTGSEIRISRAFKHNDCMFGASQKNLWCPELLHCRTAGVKGLMLSLQVPRVCVFKLGTKWEMIRMRFHNILLNTLCVSRLILSCLLERKIWSIEKLETLPSPWYNRTGWLGVIRQLTYWDTTCEHNAKDTTPSIAWRREALKKEALDDLP